MYMYMCRLYVCILVHVNANNICASTQAHVQKKLAASQYRNCTNLVHVIANECAGFRMVCTCTCMLVIVSVQYIHVHTCICIVYIVCTCGYVHLYVIAIPRFISDGTPRVFPLTYPRQTNPLWHSPWCHW